MSGPVRRVEAEESGQRIDNFLMRILKPLPKARIYRMLRRGEVRVNGGRSKPFYRVQAGDELRLPPVWRPAEAGLKDAADAPAGKGLIALLARRTLFEDEGLLVIDKPSGVAVHGGSGVRLGVIEALRRGRGDRFLELAHRLDRDTSGCLLLAKSRAALGELQQMQRSRRMAKSYQLLVSGRWPKSLNLVELPLHRFVTAAGERRVRVAADGKPARTGFNLLYTCDAASWLSARLHTGRTHQIRVHAAASGHPLLGEDKYETPESLACSRTARAARLCLHAHRIRLPWRGGELRLESPLPPLFAEVWRRLENSRQAQPTAD